MIYLYLHGHKVDSIFQLLGEDENDISCSVAWALAQCPSFLDTFLKSQVKTRHKYDNVDVRLQHSEKRGGITDFESSSFILIKSFISSREHVILSEAAHKRFTFLFTGN